MNVRFLPSLRHKGDKGTGRNHLANLRWEWATTFWLLYHVVSHGKLSSSSLQLPLPAGLLPRLCHSIWGILRALDSRASSGPHSTWKLQGELRRCLGESAAHLNVCAWDALQRRPSPHWAWASPPVVSSLVPGRPSSSLSISMSSFSSNSSAISASVLVFVTCSSSLVSRWQFSAPGFLTSSSVTFPLL